MDSNRSGRRRFLKHAAALAGLAAGAAPPASGQSAGSEAQPKDVHIHGEPSRFATTPGSGRGVRLRLDHMTYYTPLQDSAGIITPASLHFTSCKLTPPTCPTSIPSNIASRSMAWSIVL